MAAVLRETRYWHGSGRYQYQRGEIIDVFAIILKHGALQPQVDPFDKTGPMKSVSLARVRIYARAYADLHGRGAREANRHGSSSFWVSVFLGDYALEAAREEGGLKVVRERLRVSGSRNWLAKINASYPDAGVIQAFYHGSDIAENYPILFGIKRVKNPAATSRAIDLHEVRSASPIPLADITYVEVPRERVAETRRILAKHGATIPVYALEDCEQFAGTHRFSQLLR